LNGFRFRSEVLDDGTKNGGVSLGWTGSHGKFDHSFTSTIGNRISRFEEFASYAHNDDLKFAVASQG